MKRAVTVMATGLLASVATMTLAGTAAAAPNYPPKAPSMSLIGCSDIVTGVTVQVTDLLPKTPVTISWALTTASENSGSTTTESSPSGTATTTFIPDTAGDYSVTAVGTALGNAPWAGSLPVTVLPTCAPVGGEEDFVPVADTESGSEPQAAVGGLADTGGGNAGLLVALGAGAVLVGGTTVVVARNRSRGGADAS